MTINVKNASVMFGAAFTTSSSSYVDLLNAAGGSVVSITITKGSGTDILIRAGAGCVHNSGVSTATLGVNDGSTDYDVDRINVANSAYGTLSGSRLITGLPAGTYTFKLRVKSSSGQVNFQNSNAFLTAREVDPQSLNAQALNIIFASTFSLTSTSYIDLLDGSGGSAISVPITKAAGTGLLVRATASCVQDASNDNIIIGVNDGTTDYDVAVHRVFAASSSVPIGERIITGLGAGTFNLKLRAKMASGNQCNFGAGNSASLMVMEVA